MPTSRLPRPADRPQGFNLIDLLIIIGIIGILAAIVFVVVDPAKHMRQTRNTRRFNDANALLDAINAYKLKKGLLPLGIDSDASSSQMIGTAGETCSTNRPCTEASGGDTVPACLDLTTDLVAGGFLTELPIDPLGTDAVKMTYFYDAGHTGYYVQKFPNGRIEVGSCNPEYEDSGSRVLPIDVKR